MQTCQKKLAVWAVYSKCCAFNFNSFLFMKQFWSSLICCFFSLRGKEKETRLLNPARISPKETPASLGAGLVWQS